MKRNQTYTKKGGYWLFPTETDKEFGKSPTTTDSSSSGTNSGFFNFFFAF